MGHAPTSICPLSIDWSTRLVLGRNAVAARQDGGLAAVDVRVEQGNVVVDQPDENQLAALLKQVEGIAPWSPGRRCSRTPASTALPAALPRGTDNSVSSHSAWPRMRAAPASSPPRRYRRRPAARTRSPTARWDRRPRRWRARPAAPPRAPRRGCRRPASPPAESAPAAASRTCTSVSPAEECGRACRHRLWTPMTRIFAQQFVRPRKQAAHSPQVMYGFTAQRSPGLKPPTPSPVSTTSTASSCPRMRG